MLEIYYESEISVITGGFDMQISLQSPNQVFIQEVLLMAVFEQRLSFQMFYFMTKNPEITLKYSWVSGGAVSSAVGSWRSLGGSSGGKGRDKFWSFYIWRAINSL